MCELLAYDESEISYGHLYLYMNKSEEVLTTPDDSDTGFFTEVDLRYPNNIK